MGKSLTNVGDPKLLKYILQNIKTRQAQEASSDIINKMFTEFNPIQRIVLNNGLTKEWENVINVCREAFLYAIQTSPDNLQDFFSEVKSQKKETESIIQLLYGGTDNLANNQKYLENAILELTKELQQDSSSLLSQKSTGLYGLLCINKMLSLYNEEHFVQFINVSGEMMNLYHYLSLLNECKNHTLMLGKSKENCSKGGKKTAEYWQGEKNKLKSIWKQLPTNVQKSNKESINFLSPDYTNLSFRKLEIYIREWRKEDTQG